jgi:hypothetical protein
MDPEKKRGLILIIIGLIIPLFALPFVSGFSRDKGFKDNFLQTGIALGKHTQDSTAGQPVVNPKDPNAKPRITYSMLIPRRIPFRFILAPTVILIYIGIIRIDRSRRKKRSQ